MELKGTFRNLQVQFYNLTILVIVYYLVTLTVKDIPESSKLVVAVRVLTL